MPKIAVILSGCGVNDGSEIHEAVLTLLELDKAGASYFCLAPNAPQTSVVNHATHQPETESRNMLNESARIARGVIQDTAKVKASDFDAVILPGGYGAAKNLCSFGMEGAKSKAHPDVDRLLKEFHKQKKPIGAICIAPSILATLFGKTLHPKITIGTDPETAKVLEEMGAKHQNCSVEKCLVDTENLFVTTPAYMLANRISEAQKGIAALVAEVLKLIKKVS